MKRNWKKILAVLAMAGALSLAAAGCKQQDAEPAQESMAQADADAWMEEEAQASDGAEDTVDDYFDVENVEDSDADYSKYEEKKTTVTTTTAKSGGDTNEGASGDAAVQDEYGTDPVPEGQPEPVEPEDAEVDTTQELTCYIRISCATILDNLDDLEEGKEDLVPSDGMILSRQKVTFYEGESVFDVLKRVAKEEGIHMEFENTPAYNSAYIEGINNLYEFDCGSGSGWMYCVNGWYPNYGCSRYAVESGDEIEWNYTCDLGRDLGQNWVD